MKLYGGSAGARTAGYSRTTAVKARTPLKPLAIVLAVVLLFEVLYFTAVYSKNSFISKYRDMYISTAMDTLSHQWLAKAFIPADVIQEVMNKRNAALHAQEGLVSNWEKEEPPVPVEPESPSEDISTPENIETEIVIMTPEQEQEVLKEEFFRLFHELDPAETEAYFDANPDSLANGWGEIQLDAAGVNESGLDLKTIYGEQVLAIDVPNQILLIRVEDSGYKGVLAVAKDPSRLALQPSSQIGTAGETVGQIASANNGVLAMTGSGFMDDGGGGDGGVPLGLAVCSGEWYGWPSSRAGEKRLELHEDNLFYITDTSSPLGEGTTDAVEWSPAMLVDGEDVVGYGWDGLHPRACIGQSDRYEILMLIVEGRQPLRSIGITLYDCVDILQRHGGMQAINLDGGTSALMWYMGKPVTSCSNINTPEGRTMPTAWVYGSN